MNHSFEVKRATLAASHRLFPLPSSGAAAEGPAGGGERGAHGGAGARPPAGAAEPRPAAAPGHAGADAARHGGAAATSCCYYC